jgi:stress-induced morphogen
MPEAQNKHFISYIYNFFGTQQKRRIIVSTKSFDDKSTCMPTQAVNGLLNYSKSSAC